MIHALKDAADTVLRYQDFGDHEPPQLAPAKGLRWVREDPPPPPPPTPEQIIAGFVDAIQSRLDAWARTRGYDGILSLCSYATSTSPRFGIEGMRGVQLRDDTWEAGTAILAEVQAGTRPVPTWAELEAELPDLTWPA